MCVIMNLSFLTHSVLLIPSLFPSLPPSLTHQSSIFCPVGGASTWADAVSPPPLPPSPSFPPSLRPCLPLSRTLFTTEGHVFFVEPEVEQRRQRRREAEEEER